MGDGRESGWWNRKRVDPGEVGQVDRTAQDARAGPRHEGITGVDLFHTMGRARQNPRTTVSPQDPTTRGTIKQYRNAMNTALGSDKKGQDNDILKSGIKREYEKAT